MINDLRYALRVIRKYPLSNGVIVFTMASLVSVVGLWYGTFREMQYRELPFDEPERLVRLWRVGKRATTDQFPTEIYQQIRDQARSFEKLGAHTSYNQYTLTGSGEAVSLRGVHCNAELLEITGKTPVIGRFFSELDERIGYREVVILSERVWRNHFDADNSILGEPILLNDKPTVVIGVAPESLEQSHLAHNAEIWLPRSWASDSDKGGTVNIVGRLSVGAKIGRAQAELDVIVPSIEQGRTMTDFEKQRYGEPFTGARLAALDKYLHRSGTGNTQQLYANIFIFVLIGCVVLIACFNMTNLFLVQATSRAREMAVRLSVGASRWRIVRQMLFESTLLAMAGGLAGSILTVAMIRLSDASQIGLTFDPMLYAITFTFAACIGALVSILPALRSGRADLSLVLKDGGQSSAARNRHRARNFLVGAQIGMATLLTLTAVLFTRAYLNAITTETGFDANRLLSLNLQLDQRRYDKGEQVSGFAQRALEELEAMPGVVRATVCSPGVGANWRMSQKIVFLDKSRTYPDIRVGSFYVSRNYFESLGQTLQEGNLFSAGDNVLNEVILNEEFVRLMSPDKSPIGEQFRIGNLGARVFTVAGVVANRHPKLETREIQPEVYISHRHPILMSRQLGVLVETKVDAGQFASAFRETLMRLDRNQPVGPAEVVSQILERNVRPMRMVSFVILGMAGFGLCMALMGVYGVVAYAVVERTREMGIRMALGADRARIMRIVMSEGTRLLLWGGVPASVIAIVAIRSLPLQMLPGIKVDDPFTYAIGICAVAVAGTIASLIPAGRIVHLCPSQALRYE
jgi:putative ABC transport system permease protein